MYNLEQLQQQLLALQAASNELLKPRQSVNQGYPSSPDTTTPSVTLSKEVIKPIVLEILREELSSIAAKAEEQAKVQSNPLFKSIGKALKEDEQMFLTKHIDKVQDNLPSFFETEDGQLAVQSFVLYLRGKYEG